MASSKTGQTSPQKKKATAKANATRRIAERDRTGGAPKVPMSERQVSQSRFAGETPLTGEDRPKDAPGRKKR